MRGPLDHDDVEELEWRSRSEQEHRAAAEVLQAWAGEPHPDDVEVTPASLLVSAGEQLLSADDPEAAIGVFRRALEVDGDAPPDTRCYLHHALVVAGRMTEARALAEQVRRSRPTDTDVYSFLAEDYEGAGDLDQANRWFTMGLLRLDRLGDELTDPFAAATLRTGRYRVRRELGFPPDEDDLEAIAALASHRTDVEGVDVDLDD